MSRSSFDEMADIPVIDLDIPDDDDSSPALLVPPEVKCKKHIDMKEYSVTVRKMRSFFVNKGWYEVHTQSRLSILAACEDPNTISTYNYAGEVWPLPQTGQMWLEHELLSNPDVPGVFCLSTSYRNEPNPVEGRHDKIFPMFEFEMRGTIKDLVILEAELLEYLGFGEQESFVHKDYRELAQEYEVEELEHEHEDRMCNENGPVVFLENFPNHTSPFWNMKQSLENDNAHKVDVILHGIETIGSAERSTNKDEMREQFYKISGGNYANILFSNFTKNRVVKELEQFLKYNMIERCGGGIGVTRMIRAMKMSNILYKENKPVEEVIEEQEEQEEQEEVVLERLTRKRTKSRCWGLPIAAKDKGGAVASLLVGAASSGGGKAFEMALDGLL